MRRRLFALLLALLCLLLCACSPGYTRGLEAMGAKPKPSQRLETAAPSPEAPSEKPKSYPDVEPRFAVECLADAALFRELLFPEGADIPAGLNLDAEARGRVRLRLGENGLAAFDAERGEPMTNPELVYGFFQSLGAGSDASLTIYEVCHDGGLLRRDFTVRGGARELTFTRLAWVRGEARITLSEAYYLTELTLTDDGVIISDYSFPDNIPGTNHDGHVETREEIALNDSE